MLPALLFCLTSRKCVSMTFLQCKYVFFNKNNLMNTREIILGIRVSTLFDRDKACENLGFFQQITCRGLKETRPETKSATYESSYFRFSIIFIARLQQNVKGRKKTTRESQILHILGVKSDKVVLTSTLRVLFGVLFT